MRGIGSLEWNCSGTQYAIAEAEPIYSPRGLCYNLEALRRNRGDFLCQSMNTGVIIAAVG